MNKQDEARFIGAWLEFNRIEPPERLKMIARASTEDAQNMLTYSFKELKVKLTKIK